jgi:hypothetical protein
MRKRIQRQENLTWLINGGAEEGLVILLDCVGVVGGVLGLEGLEVLGRVGVGVGGGGDRRHMKNRCRWKGGPVTV